MLGWTRSLPESVVRRSPVLNIMSGWSLMMAGDLDGMERRLDDAEAALAAGAHDQALAATWADTEDLRTAPATLWVYRAALAQARGDVPATVRHARRALDLAGADDHFVRGAAAGFLGLAAWAAGDVQEALSTFSEAVRSLHAAGNLVDELDSTVVLGDMWISCGPSPPGAPAVRAGPETATGAGEPYPRATADLHVGLAELDRELDDLVGAEEHLETARVLGERGSITENRHRWYVAMAQVRAATGDHAPPAVCSTRPRRCTGPASTPTSARSPPCEPAWTSRRETSPRPRSGRTTTTSPRPMTRLPARVRPPHPRAAPARPPPRPRGLPPATRRHWARCWRCWTGSTPTLTGRAPAVCWRSACCEPSPITPAGTDWRPSPS